mmetsp:Transcript_37564/g.75715  ORF Transcript_37564/g.75715 Transcript_37564/m.75715 type:complete len:129 (+) Transcript_37564:96-482(+)
MVPASPEPPSQAALPLELDRSYDFEDVAEQPSPFDEQLLDAKRQRAFFPKASPDTSSGDEQQEVDTAATLAVGSVLRRLRRVRAFEGRAKATELAQQLAQQIQALADANADGAPQDAPDPPLTEGEAG